MWIAKNVDRAECGSCRMWICVECRSCRMWICVECGSCRLWICVDEQNLDKEIRLIALSKNSRKGEKWIRNGKVVNIEVLPFACYKPMSSVICHVNKAFLFYYNYSYKQVHGTYFPKDKRVSPVECQSSGGSDKKGTLINHFTIQM